MVPQCSVLERTKLSVVLPQAIVLRRAVLTLNTNCASPSVSIKFCHDNARAAFADQTIPIMRELVPTVDQVMVEERAASFTKRSIKTTAKLAG